MSRRLPTQRDWQALFRAAKAKAGVNGGQVRISLGKGEPKIEVLEEEPPLSAYDRRLMERQAAKAAARNHPDRRERVYFIRAQTLGLIKIGVAGDLDKRLAGLQCGSPDKLEVIGTIVGENKLERELHKRFAHLRQHGEWFSPGEDLLAYIREQAE